jgi:selenocysteine-specific elongation factor
MLALGAASLQEVITRSNLDTITAETVFQELLKTGQILGLNNSGQGLLSPQDLITSKGYWDQLSLRAVTEVEDYHKTYPLRRGIPREELKSRLKLSPRLFNATMQKIVSDSVLIEAGPLVQRPGYSIQFTLQQKNMVEKLLGRFAASPFAPPSAKECLAEVGEDIYTAMVDLGLLIPIPPDVVFRPQDYETMVAEVIKLLKNKGTITAAEVRDHFNTSRRYVLALLEFLDAQGITIRTGDIRHLKQNI